MKLLVTHPRLTGVSERVAYGVLMFILMKFVAAGHIDTVMAEYIALGVISGGGALYAWWINRPGKILEAASNVSNPDGPGGKTVIVTQPELVLATPALMAAPNVMSSDDCRVVPRHAG